MTQPRCNYCRKSAAKWFQYRGYISRPGRMPHTPLITVAACEEHSTCVNYVSMYQLKAESGQILNEVTK